MKKISSSANSIGDALREVHQMSIMRDDFIVVRGDIITNIDLTESLKMHYIAKALEDKKENQTTDTRKNRTILTKLFVKQSDINPLRDPSTDIMLMLDSQTKEIYKYVSCQ